MATRKAILAAGAGIAFERLVSSCERKPERPEPMPSPSVSPSRIPPILDLTGLMANTPRVAAATEATRSAARLLLDNTSQGKHNLISAVQVEPGLFLSVEHVRRKTINGTAEDPIDVTRYRLRLAMRDAAGGLAPVMRATRAAMVRDFGTDAALFQVENVPSGLAVANRVELTSLERGAVLHHVGYQPAPGTKEFDIPITQPAPQAGVRMALLTDSGSQFLAIAGIGPSEGDFPATKIDQGSSGGPVYTTAGKLVGTVVESNRGTVTIGDILDGRTFGTYERVVNDGQDVPRDLQVQIVTCQTADDLLLNELRAGLAPIPDPGN